MVLGWDYWYLQSNLNSWISSSIQTWSSWPRIRVPPLTRDRSSETHDDFISRRWTLQCIAEQRNEALASLIARCDLASYWSRSIRSYRICRFLKLEFRSVIVWAILSIRRNYSWAKSYRWAVSSRIRVTYFTHWRLKYDYYYSCFRMSESPSIVKWISSYPVFAIFPPVLRVFEWRIFLQLCSHTFESNRFSAQF